MTSPPVPSDPPMLDLPHPDSSDSYHLPMPPALEGAESAHMGPPPLDIAPVRPPVGRGVGDYSLMTQAQAAGFRRSRYRALRAMVKRAETKILGLEYTVVTVDGYIQNLRGTLMPPTGGFGGGPVLAVRGKVNVARIRSPRELCTEQVLRMENDEDVKALEEVVEDLGVYGKVEKDPKALEEAHKEAVRLAALGSSSPPAPVLLISVEKWGLDTRGTGGQVDGSDDNPEAAQPITKRARSQVMVGGGERDGGGGSAFVDRSVDGAGTSGVARPQTAGSGEWRYNRSTRGGDPPEAANRNNDGGTAAAGAGHQHAEKPPPPQQQQQHDDTNVSGGPVDRWAYEAGVGHSTFSSMRRDGA